MKRQSIHIHRKHISSPPCSTEHPAGAFHLHDEFPQPEIGGHANQNPDFSGFRAAPPRTEKLLKSCQEKLDEIHNQILIEDIWEIINYYNLRTAIAMNLEFVRMFTDKQLKEGVQKTTRWKQFVKVYEWCKENGYDFHIYIDYMFERCKMYKSYRKPYPPVNHLCSEKAMNDFPRWMEDYGKTYSIIGTAKPSKPVSNSSWIKEVSDCLIDDITRIHKFIEKYDGDPMEGKIVCIATKWISLSKYTLSVVPWFIDYANGLGDSNFVSRLREDIRSIRGSQSQLSKIQKLTEYTEKSMGVPVGYYTQEDKERMKDV